MTSVEDSKLIKSMNTLRFSLKCGPRFEPVDILVLNGRYGLGLRYQVRVLSGCKLIVKQKKISRHQHDRA